MNDTRGSFSKDQCYSYFGEEKQNTSACAKIERVEARDLCYASIAYKNPSKEICLLLKGETRKVSCWSNLAASQKDETICKNIQSQKDVWGCIASIARVTENSSLCSQIPNIPDSSGNNPIFEKDICYRNSAQSVEECGKITSTFELKGCLFNVAVTKKDSSICEKITDLRTKAGCFSQIEGR